MQITTFQVQSLVQLLISCINELNVHENAEWQVEMI